MLKDVRKLSFMLENPLALKSCFVQNLVNYQLYNLM